MSLIFWPVFAATVLLQQPISYICDHSHIFFDWNISNNRVHHHTDSFKQLLRCLDEKWENVWSNESYLIILDDIQGREANCCMRLSWQLRKPSFISYNWWGAIEHAMLRHDKQRPMFTNEMILSLFIKFFSQRVTSKSSITCIPQQPARITSMLWLNWPLALHWLKILRD